ncbi:MAG: hypothetical protein ACK54C_02290, partial [Betaproteobacteria bacterium]
DDPRVPELARQVLHEVNARIRALDEDILAYDRRISAQVRDSAAMQRIVKGRRIFPSVVVQISPPG